MTHEEAIAWLDKAKGNAEAIQMAKNALNANIKIKPIKSGLYWWCPQCKKEDTSTTIGYYYDGMAKTMWYKACPTCASLIDWSEEER